MIAILDAGRWAGMAGGPQQREITTTAEDGSYVLDTLSRESRYRFGVVAEGFAAVFATNGRQIDTEATRNFELVTGGRIEESYVLLDILDLSFNFEYDYVL